MIRVAIVGTGNISHAHVNAYLKFPERCRIVALVDIVPEKAQRMKEKYDLWWRGTWEKEGGGCTLNHAVHHIDMLCWMMGLPQKVTSILANVAHDNAEVEDLSASILQYPGALAQLTASVVHHAEEQQLVFQCEKAKIAAPFSCYASNSMGNGFPTRNEALEKKIADYAAALPRVKWEGHDGQLENILTAIETGDDVAIAGEEGRRTIELITSIYKSGATGQTVELPLQKDDPFYTVEGIMKSVPHFYEKTVSADELSGEITLGSNYKKRRHQKSRWMHPLAFLTSPKRGCFLTAATRRARRYTGVRRPCACVRWRQAHRW